MAGKKGMADSIIIRLDNFTKALKTARLQRRVQRHLRPVRQGKGSSPKPADG
jgi:hypothetical protein